MGDSDASASARRKRTGAWYTPADLVDHVLDHVLDPLLDRLTAGSVVDVLDPACGDGRFLVAAARRIRSTGSVPRLVGVDIDPGACAAARAALDRAGERDADVVCADALARDWGVRRFDLVVGNPPFLSPLAAAHGVRAERRGGPYADAAAEFLALAARLVRRPGGRIGLILPLSVLAARDALPVRQAVEAVARAEWCWFSPRPVFDAEVRTCALGFVSEPPTGGDDGDAHSRPGARPAAGGHAAPRAELAREPSAAGRGGPLRGRGGLLRRTFGPQFTGVDPVAAVLAPSWSWMIADLLGVPLLPGGLGVRGTIGDRATCTAGFRDQYYGLVGAVIEDDGAGRPPLVTSGLIDPGRCRWGEREARFAKRRFARPVVDLAAVPPPVAGWFAARLVPKVLVASQTRLVEAVADPHGLLLPCVPVISLTPDGGVSPWELAAVLTGPVATVVLASRVIGSGMSAHALRVTAAELAALPWPAGALDEAVGALRDGAVEECAAAVTSAYGIDRRTAEPLVEWWSANLPRR